MNGSLKYISWMIAVPALVILGSCSLAQKPTISINYLGQKPPGMNALVFAKGIVSTDSIEHSSPAFSPDGKSVLWTAIYRNKPSFLLEMEYDNDHWNKPARPTFGDTTADDFYPSFSSDGKTLYFSSRRTVPGFPPHRGIRIWTVSKSERGWGNPVPLDSTISSGGEYGHSVADNGTLYFTSDNRWDIYRSVKSGNDFQKPELVPVNTQGYEDGPFIAPDESFLIFESDRPEGVKGSIDLYITFRMKDGSWSSPKNMGDKINSAATERFAKVSPDGKYLFFGSNRAQLSDNLYFDIYWIDAKVIESLR
jgi:Tol biopolymer transport system component